MYRIGQTATHKDGRKIQWDGENWVAAGGQNSDRSGSLTAPEQKTIADQRVAAQNIRGARSQAFEFVKANARTGTGGLMAIPGASELVGAWNPEVSTMQGLSNAMVPGMHVTPGPMTDADAKLYKSAIPNPNLPRKTNLNLARDISRKEQEVAARSTFFERYAQRMGTLNGADVAFNKFWAGYKASPAGPKRPITANAPRKGQAPAPAWQVVGVED